MTHTVWIALGSNQQNPVNQLILARATLATLLREEAASSLYRTPPFGIIEQPDFINAVIRYQTDLKAHDILALLMRIEQEQGRVRTIKNGPRTLDLDILLYDRECINTPELIVPHPAMHIRDFVLVPLSEINPKINIPGIGEIQQCLATLSPMPSLPIVENAGWPSP